MSARMLTNVTVQTQVVLYICNIILHSVSQNCIVCVREEIFFVKMSFQPIFNNNKNSVCVKLNYTQIFKRGWQGV